MGLFGAMRETGARGDIERLFNLSMA
jgi:hypothetical protein